MRDDAHRDKSQENMDLSSLSVADLEAQLEQALEHMTEETYDESLVEVYIMITIMVILISMATAIYFGKWIKITLPINLLFLLLFEIGRAHV